MTSLEEQWSYPSQDRKKNVPHVTLGCTSMTLNVSSVVRELSAMERNVSVVILKLIGILVWQDIISHLNAETNRSKWCLITAEIARLSTLWDLNNGQMRVKVDESQWLSSTPINFKLVQILMKVDESFWFAWKISSDSHQLYERQWKSSRANSRLSTATYFNQSLRTL